MSRRDVRALVGGMLVGAVVALAVLIFANARLRPGSFPTTEATLPTPFVLPTATPRPSLPLVLEPDGLGPISFGTDEATAVDELSGLLGEPRSDERWQCADPPGEVRLVDWADLAVFFLDGTFRGYIVGVYYPTEAGPPLGLETAEGLAAGASVEELEAIYGDRATLTEPEGPVEGEVLDLAIDGEDGVGGLVEGSAESGRVIAINAGTACFRDATP